METLGNSSRNRIWRWAALVAVLVNIFFNYNMNANPPGGLTNAEVSARYPTLFTPAGYAFSIWGVIYLSFIGYIIFQLLPSQRKQHVYDVLAKPLIITSILSICWLFSFSYELLLLSVCIIVLMLFTAIVLFVRSKEAIQSGQVNKLISVPFALYAGWLSVATIANTSLWLTSMDWEGGSWGAIPWTMIMIGVAAVLGVVVSYKLKDIVFPSVVVWAIIAIYIARQNQEQTVATFALVTAIILAVWVIVNTIRLGKKPQIQPAV
ncbi:tryptophan-rich sensory protein [Rhodocytophaga rosea]|uniref:Tryptophan-rich sensory protein n=1 Tax=Rhodocytophaga rosea TaxID=2704465 RepID=A0A6C0GJ94_9BACT|nr:tryptophan-rich sensory protein [Rhodocytophaga rosea]QHT68019.1 tryptophan-rich sensory protein [Rhodocytophaga rosea]